MECQGKMPRAVTRKAESTDVHVCGGLPRSSVEVSVMGMERRGEQSISLSMSRIAEMTTSAVTNRVKGGQIKRDGKERTHGHK